MNRSVAEQEQTSTGLQAGPSPPRKRSKTQIDNSIIQSSLGNLVAESGSTNDPMVEAGIAVQQVQGVSRQLTDPGELIDASTVRPPWDPDRRKGDTSRVHHPPGPFEKEHL